MFFIDSSSSSSLEERCGQGPAHVVAWAKSSRKGGGLKRAHGQARADGNKVAGSVGHLNQQVETAEQGGVEQFVDGDAIPATTTGTSGTGKNRRGFGLDAVPPVFCMRCSPCRDDSGAQGKMEGADVK